MRLAGPQVECLWDEVLPSEVRELPDDLARIDELLSDPALLEPIAAHGRQEGQQIRTGWGNPRLQPRHADRLGRMKG